MKKYLVCFCMFWSALLAQEKEVPVFTSGTEGCHTFRIPALVRLPNGDLLAFAEGRVKKQGDFGNIDIVMKRSTDQGNTWGKIQTVVDNKDVKAGNPSPVVDLTDKRWPNGRLFLFYVTSNNEEKEVENGNGINEMWYKTSVDGGLTWSDGVNITKLVHRPNQPQYDTSYHFSEDWRHFHPNPGHAMQFKHGKYKGRLYVAANHSSGILKSDNSQYDVQCFYSDDHGATFKLSEAIHHPGSNETMAVELGNGGLMLSSRNEKRDEKYRILSFSHDGGETWDTSYFDKNLPDPVCEGSILDIGRKKGKHIIAICNNSDTLYRDSLTLHISDDEGRTWGRKLLVDCDKNRKDHHKSWYCYTSYSDFVVMDKNRLGIVYEKEFYKKIVFTVRKWR